MFPNSRDRQRSLLWSEDFLPLEHSINIWSLGDEEGRGLEILGVHSPNSLVAGTGF